MNPLASRQTSIDWKKNVTIFAVIGSFLTLLHPFGLNVGGGLIGNWFFWTAHIILGSLIGTFTTGFTKKHFKTDNWLHHLLITPPIIAIGITASVFGTFAILAKPIPSNQFGWTYLSIWFVSISITGLAIILSKAGIISSENDKIESTVAPSHIANANADRFLKRLPLKYQTATLYAVTSEDHYLRVYTHLGDELILMRLSDALEELSNIEGCQTHRSWWIAKDGIKDVKKDAGKTKIILQNDIEAPVSRPNVSKLKQLGWL